MWKYQKDSNKYRFTYILAIIEKKKVMNGYILENSDHVLKLNRNLLKVPINKV